MSDDMSYGAATNGVGALEEASRGARGKLSRAAGQVQDVFGKVKGQAGKVRGQAGDAYDRALTSARGQVGELEGYVRERPLAALGVVAAAGLLVGLILGGGLGAIGHREYERRR